MGAHDQQLNIKGCSPGWFLSLRYPLYNTVVLATLYIESSDSFVASAAVSIVTGWSEPVPGRELHPLKSSAFHGALLRQLPGRQSQLCDRGGASDGSAHEPGDRRCPRHDRSVCAMA